MKVDVLDLRATKLHELRAAAHELVETNGLHEAITAFLTAADYAQQIGLRLEADHLRSQARRVVVLAWARRASPMVRFADVVVRRSARDPLGLWPARRFRIMMPQEPVIVTIDRRDRVRRLHSRW